MDEIQVTEALKQELSQLSCVRILQDGAASEDITPTAYAMFELLCNTKVRGDKAHWYSFLEEALNECISDAQRTGG